MKTLLLALCLLLAGCGSKQDRPRVRLAVPGPGFQTFDLPFHLAQALGFYREEGLDVDLQSLPSHTQTMQALIGGSVDVAAVTYPQVVQVAAQSQRVRSFFVINRIDTKTLVVAPAWAGRIHRVEDLKETAIGIPSPGSACHQWIIYYLAARGIRQEEVSFISVGVSAAALAAMESGRIGCACLPGGDHFRLLRRHPDARVLVDGSTPEGMRETYGSSYYAGETLSAKQEWVDRNPDTARRLARALRRSLQWIAAHTPAAIRAKMSESSHSVDAALDGQIIDWGRAGYTPDGAMPVGAPDVVKRYLYTTDAKVRGAKFDLAATWTDAYLQETN